MALKVLGLVLHLSASRWGDAEEITKWHKAPPRNWSTIGYHAVGLNGLRDYGDSYDIKVDGKIEPGRPETMQGAHCLAGGMNTCTLGYCNIGTPGWIPSGAEPAPSSVTKHQYLTMRQFHATLHWIRVNCKQYGLDPHGTFVHPSTRRVIAVVSQHSDHDAGKPLCASLNIKELLEHL